MTRNCLKKQSRSRVSVVPQGSILLQLTRSLPAVAKTLPSGLKLQQHTGPSCPRSSALQGKSSTPCGCVSSLLGHSRTVKSSALETEREVCPENQSKTGLGGQRKPWEQSTASKKTAPRKGTVSQSPGCAQVLLPGSCMADSGRNVASCTSFLPHFPQQLLQELRFSRPRCCLHLTICEVQISHFQRTNPALPLLFSTLSRNNLE